MPAGRYAEATEGLLRTTVLDAVNDLLRDHEWDSLSMAVIARAAGVSRQTLYNEFGNREDLAEAYVVREAGAFLEDIAATIADAAPDVELALGGALTRFLDGARAHPALLAITTGQGSAALLGSLVNGPGSPVLGIATERLSQLLEEHWPRIAPVERDALSDVIVRWAISHATQPVPVDHEVSVAGFVRILSPALQGRS